MEYTDKTPGQIANDILVLSAKYGDLSDELGRIYKHKDVDWTLIRDTVTSDKQTEQIWRKTELGMREREIELEMKKVQKTISALKTYLNVKENEARGLY